MADFVPEPRDRLEGPICKAVELKDFKQALKLVEKRLAKNADPYLLVCLLPCTIASSLSCLLSTHYMMFPAFSHPL